MIIDHTPSQVNLGMVIKKKPYEKKAHEIIYVLKM